MRADLHIHTTASDGSWTPEVLVAKLIEAGIGLFSVTDHESTANTDATARLAAQHGLKYLKGVEISTTIHGKCFHILGYGIDTANHELQGLLARNTALLEQTDDESIKKLIVDGFAVDYDEYCAYTHDPARGGWKSLSFLIDKGVCRDVDDFFNRLFTAERSIKFPNFPSPRQIISVIKEAGGVAVLAHPGSSFHGTELEETLDFFAGEDIDGIECYHSSHTGATTKQALAWCRRKGLLITGGSDCHGDFIPHRRLGISAIGLDELFLGDLLGKI